MVVAAVVAGLLAATPIAASAQVETNAITIDPERLLELQAGESYGPSDEGFTPRKISFANLNGRM